MTKKDYIRIANALVSVRPVETEECFNTWFSTLEAIEAALKAENPRFSSTTFEHYCLNK